MMIYAAVSTVLSAKCPYKISLFKSDAVKNRHILLGCPLNNAGKCHWVVPYRQKVLN